MTITSLDLPARDVTFNSEAIFRCQVSTFLILRVYHTAIVVGSPKTTSVVIYFFYTLLDRSLELSLGLPRQLLCHPLRDLGYQHHPCHLFRLSLGHPGQFRISTLIARPTIQQIYLRSFKISGREELQCVRGSQVALLPCRQAVVPCFIVEVNWFSSWCQP